MNRKVYTMEYFRKALVRAAIPLGITAVLTIIVQYGTSDAYQVKSTFLSCLIVTFVAAFSVIYDIEGWSLKKQSVVHFIAMGLTVLPCLVVSGWYQLQTPVDFIKLFAVFVGVGLILWTIGYVIFSKIDKKR